MDFWLCDCYLQSRSKFMGGAPPNVVCNGSGTVTPVSVWLAGAVIVLPFPDINLFWGFLLSLPALLGRSLGESLGIKRLRRVGAGDPDDSSALKQTLLVAPFVK